MASFSCFKGKINSKCSLIFFFPFQMIIFFRKCWNQTFCKCLLRPRVDVQLESLKQLPGLTRQVTRMFRCKDFGCRNLDLNILIPRRKAEANILVKQYCVEVKEYLCLSWK